MRIYRCSRLAAAVLRLEASGWALRGRHFVTPCTECHTAQRWIGLPTDCFDCHALDVGPATVPAHAPGRTECNDCHGTWNW